MSELAGCPQNGHNRSTGSEYFSCTCQCASNLIQEGLPFQKCSDTTVKSNLGPVHKKVSNMIWKLHVLFDWTEENHQTQSNQSNRLQTFPYLESLKHIFI